MFLVFSVYRCLVRILFYILCFETAVDEDKYIFFFNPEGIPRHDGHLSVVY